MASAVLVTASVLLGLLLSVLPLPLWLQWARPEWLALLVIYWVLTIPDRMGVGSAWLLGLCLDAVTGAVLGQNAFTLAVVAYIVLIMERRFRMFLIWQQAAIVFMLAGLAQLLGYWIKSWYGTPAQGLVFLLPALVSALLWPWFVLLMRRVCRLAGLTPL